MFLRHEGQRMSQSALAYASKAEQEAEVRRVWTELGNALDAFLQEPEHLEIFREMRRRMEVFFRAAVADREPFQWRPPISLRLIVQGSQPAKLVIAPHLHRDRDGVYLRPETHCIELLEQVDVETKNGKAWHGERQLAIENTGYRRDVPTASRFSKNALADAARLVTTLRDFLTDHRTVLARSCDQCSICGKGLTDELSRARGIGPECIKGPACKAMLGESWFARPEETAPELVADLRV
jgi:hypothetical protein